VFGLADWHRDGTLCGVCSHEARKPRAAAGRRRLHGGREPCQSSGLTAWQGLFQQRPSSGGAECPRARRGRRSGSMVDAASHGGRRLQSSAPGTRRTDREKALDFGRARSFGRPDNDALEDSGGVDLVFDVTEATSRSGPQA